MMSQILYFCDFIFQGSQDFGIVLYLYAIVNFRGLNFHVPHIIRENNEIYVTQKIVRVGYAIRIQ